MARDYRTLKLEILAETKQFVDDMKKSEKQVEGFGGKMEKFGKMAAAAFAAAAAAAVAYAGKLAIDGVKAAIADEAAQNRLANALKNVTGATNTQIAAVEKQIEKMSFAYGVADEQLRPAFQRLAVATGSLSDAQEGLQLALDISAATGKSVEAVSNALGKAYEGNTGALTRLGIGLSSAEIKSLGLKGTMEELSRTFGGSATVQANTLEGQINRLRIRFDEAKESIGAALLPAVKSFVDYIVNRFIPLLIEAKDRALDPIQKAFEDNKDAIRSLWQFTKDYLVPLFEFTLVNSIERLGQAIAGIMNIIGKVMDGIKILVRTAVDGINALINAYNAIPFLPNVNNIQIPSFATTAGGVGMQLIGKGGTSSGLGGGFTFGGSTGAGGGAGGTAGKAGTTKGGISADLSNIPIINALQKLESNLILTNKQLQSGAISPYQAQLQLNEYLNMRDALMAQASEMGAMTSGTTGISGGLARGEYGDIYINVNAPSVIDETGFTRAVVDAMNSVERRQAGGASALIGL